MSNDAEIRQQLDRIERCLVGDEQMGQLGLVQRVNNHAARLKKLELWVYRVGAGIGGGVAVVSVIYKAVTDWWPRQ